MAASINTDLATIDEIREEPEIVRNCNEEVHLFLTMNPKRLQALDPDAPMPGALRFPSGAPIR